MNNGIKFSVLSAMPTSVEPNTMFQVGSALYIVDQNGAISKAGGGIRGQATLVAGTLAISVPGTKTTSLAFIQLVTPNSAALTVERQAVCTADTLTITALIGAKTINAADVSVVNYEVYL